MEKNKGPNKLGPITWVVIGAISTLCTLIAGRYLLTNELDTIELIED